MKKTSMKQLKLVIAMIATLSLLLSLTILAQTPTLVRRAELAVPFGTITGRLVVVADYMVFVDEDRNEDSFTLARSEIKDFKAEGDTLKIEMKRAVRTRAGESTSFSFRLHDGSSEALALWAGTTSTATTSTFAHTGLSEAGEQWVYNAKHPHTVARVPSGSCTGKLIVNQERLVYESLEDREHTRQWLLVDIKKIKRKSPYKIEVEPFNRDKYTLELEGQGMDISVFKKLQNWISLSRQRR